MDTPLAVMHDIFYTYPDSEQPALSGASIELRAGEVHCLVGENGSGKSTLMHILSGYIKGGVEGTIATGNAYIRMVHQHPLIAGDLSVWEHLAAGHPRYARKPFLTPAVRTSLIAKLSAYPLFASLIQQPDLRGAALSPLMKHHLSLASAVISGAEIIILDEPSAHLSPAEKNGLFALLGQLKAEGKAVVLITHKMNELKETGDRITALKKGEHAGTWKVKDFLASQAAEILIPGRKNESQTAFRQAPSVTCSRPQSRTLLSLKGIHVSRGREQLSGINFELHEGEILGITGLRGEGLDLLEHLLSGIAGPQQGEIHIQGQSYQRLTPKLLRNLGIGYIPTDRLLTGATADASIEDNMILLSYKHLHAKGIFKRQEIDTLTARLYRSFGITGGGPGQPLKRLSGGNIQRVIVSREFSTEPDIMIFAEPYWGLDAQGKELIRSKIASLAEKGTGVIILSPEIDDILELCPRVLVLYEGTVVLDKTGASEQEIARAQMGIGNSNGDRTA